MFDGPSFVVVSLMTGTCLDFFFLLLSLFSPCSFAFRCALSPFDSDVEAQHGGQVPRASAAKPTDGGAWKDSEGARGTAIRFTVVE